MIFVRYPNHDMPEHKFQELKERKFSKPIRDFIMPNKKEKKRVVKRKIKNDNKDKINNINNQRLDINDIEQEKEKDEIVYFKKEIANMNIELNIIKNKKKDIENKIDNVKLEINNNKDEIDKLNKDLNDNKRTNENLIKNIESTFFDLLLFQNYKTVLFVDNKNSNINIDNKKFNFIFYSNNKLEILNSYYNSYKYKCIQEYYINFSNKCINDNYYIFYINQFNDNSSNIMKNLEEMEKDKTKIEIEKLDNKGIIYRINKNNLIEKITSKFTIFFIDFAYPNLSDILTYIKLKFTINLKNINKQIENKNYNDIKILNDFNQDKPRKILILSDVVSDFLNSNLFIFP